MKALLLTLIVAALPRPAAAETPPPGWSDVLIAAVNGRLNVADVDRARALDGLIRDLRYDIPPGPELDAFMKAWERPDRPWSPARRSEEFAQLRALIALKLLRERARVSATEAPADVRAVAPEFLYDALRIGVGASLIDGRNVELNVLDPDDPIERDAYVAFARKAGERLAPDLEDLIRSNAARRTRRPFFLATLAVALPAAAVWLWLDPQPAWLAPAALGATASAAVIAAAWHAVVFKRRVTAYRAQIARLVATCEGALGTFSQKPTEVSWE